MDLKNNRSSFSEAFTAFSVLLVFAVSTWLYYLFITGEFFSDFPAHISAAVNREGYSLMHIIFRLCYKVTDKPILAAEVMGLITAVTVFAVYCFFGRILCESDVCIDNRLMLLISISAVFLSAAYIPKLSPNFYVSATTLTQPWHNSTWLLMRLFGYAVLAVYFYLLKRYKEKGHLKAFILFWLMLSLANFAKPSFLLAFAPAMLITLIYELVVSKGKQLVSIIKFGSCVLLSLPVIFYQMGAVYGGGGDSHIVFSLEKVIRITNNFNWFGTLVSNLIFPVLVTAVLLKQYLKNRETDISRLVQAWLMFLISYAQMLFMNETGPRAGDGNYAWGVYFFAGVLFVVCLAEWICAYKKSRIEKKYVFYIGCLFYLINAVNGVYYFASLINGEHYLR